MALSFQSIFSMLSTAPLAQELCLFCFFCLGFAVCRLNVVKHFIGQATGFSASRRCSPAELLALLKQGRYEEVCETWPFLEDFTLETFSAVVESLLALDRPEDVGLFFYKAAVNLSHLRPKLYQSIRAIEQSQVPTTCISIALQEVFQNRGPLDERSRQELLVAFARTNDEKYAEEAFEDLQRVSREIIDRTVQGFLSCSNLDAAIQYLQKAQERGSLALQELLLETAYAVEADAHNQRTRMCQLLALGDDFPPLLACAFRVAVASDAQDVYDLAVSALKGPGIGIEVLAAFVQAAQIFDPLGGVDVLKELVLDEDAHLAAQKLRSHADEVSRAFLDRAFPSSWADLSEGLPVPSSTQLGSLGSLGLQEASGDQASQPGGPRTGLVEAPPHVEHTLSLLSAACVAGDRDSVDGLKRMEGTTVDSQSLRILFQGRCRAKDFDKAMQLVARHPKLLDEQLVNVILEACVALRDTPRLHQLLSLLKRCQWDMPLLWSGASSNSYAALIKAYGSTDQIGKAQELWQCIRQQGTVPNEQMFAQMIDVLVTGGRFPDAHQLFCEMRMVHQERMASSGVAMAYAMIVKGYTQQKDAASALRCYEEMKVLGVQVGVVVLNTLIDACCRSGALSDATQLLDDMARFEIVPDLITYSTLIKGHCSKGDLDKALELFGAMRRRGIKPDAIVFNSLLDGCARKELPMLCEQVISDMIAAGVQPSNYSASILIKLYGRISDLDAAFKVLEEMPLKFGFRPNAAVYTTLMSSCTWNGRMDLAMSLKTRMVQDGQVADEKTYSTLLRGATRSGQCEHIVSLLWEVLQLGESKNRRRVLENEVVQNALQSMWRRNWDTEDLLQRLWSAGYDVKRPQGKNSLRYERSKRTKC